VEWYGKPAEEILRMRQDDLTQKAGESLIECKNKVARFEKEIENSIATSLTKATASIQPGI
jgi:hypothetical protein